MSERYTRLFSLPGNQYTKGSPLLIAAGALLKDNQTGKVLAQLKFRSISEAKIKAIKIAIAAYDISGNALAGVEEYQYLDLEVCRNEEFGHKQAVTLPNAVTRSVVVKCTEVFFEDGTVWHTEGNAEWEAISTQQTIAEYFGELADQYCRDTSHLSKFALLECEDIWLCTCGAINHNSEPRCHQCNYEKSELLAASELEGLRQRKSDYEKELAEKAEIKAREAAQKAEQKAAESKVRCAKILKTGIALGAVAAVCVIAFLLITKVVIPSSHYKDAIALMDSGEYDEAIIAFEALNGFKDSENKVNECNTAILDSKYNDALVLMNTGKYEEAIAAFNALDGYKDSAKKANECNTAILDADYNAALVLLDAGKYDEAILAFEALGDYTDAFNKLQEAKYQKGKMLILAGSYDDAYLLLASVIDYKDSYEVIAESKYTRALNLIDKKAYAEAKALLESIPDYKDASTLLNDFHYRIVSISRGSSFNFSYEFDESGTLKAVYVRYQTSDYSVEKNSGYACDAIFTIENNRPISSVQKWNEGFYKNTNIVAASNEPRIVNAEYTYANNKVLVNKTSIKTRTGEKGKYAPSEFTVYVLENKSYQINISKEYDCINAYGQYEHNTADNWRYKWELVYDKNHLDGLDYLYIYFIGLSSFQT